MLAAAARRAASSLRSSAAASAALRPGARGYAGHGPSHGDVTHAGVTLHPAASWHKNVATGMSAIMWFWVLLRWKEDGATLIFGHAPHFAHELEDENAHLVYKPPAK